MIVEKYLYVCAVDGLLDGIDLGYEEKALYTYLVVQRWKKLGEW